MKCWLLCIGLILTLCPMLCQAQSSSTLDPNTVEPITLPQLGDPYQGPADLAGQTGFFWTRFATEQAVEALKTVPILQSEITSLTEAGSMEAVKADQVKSTIRYYQIACILFPLAAILIEEIRHATTP